MRRLAALLLVAACGGSHGGTRVDAPTAGDGAAASDAAGACSTRITYGSTWIKPSGHTAAFDIANDSVTWDGTCTDDGANSYATLSNGWKPYFTGHQACAIALDAAPSCAAAPTQCTTRITYSDAWLHPANHAAQYDDVDGRIFWDGACAAAGSDSAATLSNGWQPHFSGASSCGLSLRWTGCGGLYTNPVIPKNCADPGVTQDGARYILSCTSGNATNAFPLYTSTDLITWTQMGHILPAASRPAWAVSDFWAPEIHKIGAQWIAYFTARGSDGKLAIGAAYATDILGPYTPQAQPLVHSTTVGLIDATAFSDGTTDYLAWKEDGNAIGAATPIRARALAVDGLSLTGTTATLITNDQTWEGNLVEGPWVTKHGGDYVLFYSGNAYYDGRYAVGVARASSPLGPYTKAAAPIVTTNADWVGPGHCSVVPGLGGETYMVYHAWQAGHVNGPGDGRLVLVDQVQWGADGWPHVFGGPSTASRPAP